MVTASAPRLPHPLQSGAKPAAAWLARRTVNTVLAAVLIVLLPTAVPNTVQVSYPVVFLYIALAITGILAHLWLDRVARFNTPGALVGHDSSRRGPIVWPAITASAVSAAVECVAINYAAQRGNPDGSTAMIFAMFAGAWVVLLCVYLGRDAIRRDAGGAILTLVGVGVPVGALVLSTTYTVPDPKNLAWNVGLAGAMIAVVSSAVVIAVRWVLRSQHAGVEASEGVAFLADTVTRHIDPGAPLSTQLRHRDAARALAVVGAAIAVVVVPATFVLMP